MKSLITRNFFAKITLPLVSMLIAGCATTSTVSNSEKAQLPKEKWAGVWFGNSVSFYGHESSNGLLLRNNGTGYLVSSAIFEPRHNPSFWVRRIDFTWALDDQTSATARVTGKQTLAGDGSEGLFGNGSIFKILATNSGLKVANFGKQNSPFLKYPGKFTGDVATKVTNETRNKALALGGNETPYSGPTFAQIAQGALKSYQQGLAIGGAANPGSGSGSQTNQAARSQDIVGQVQLGSAEIAAYTDGKAYNVLTLLPVDGNSGGEWCYQYGITIDNARSVLATGYALAADRSAYGPGNPRQIISWESVRVSQGSRIKMGIEWKKGQMVNVPLRYRYESSPP